MKKNHLRLFTSLALAVFLIFGTVTNTVFAQTRHSNYNTIGKIFFNDIVPFYVSLKSEVNTYYNSKYVDRVQTFGTIPKAPELLWEINTHDIGITNNGSLVKYTQSPSHYSMLANSNFYYNGHELYVGKYVSSGSIKSSANMYAIESYNGWSFNNNYVEDVFNIR